MFGLFKNKEKKQEDVQKSLENELKEFTEKYQEYFNCYAFNGKDIVIYKEPQILEGELVMNYIDANTPKGYVNRHFVWILNLKYGSENFLIQHRENYIKLKDQMEKLGLSVTKNQTNK